MRWSDNIGVDALIPVVKRARAIFAIERASPRILARRLIEMAVNDYRGHALLRLSRFGVREIDRHSRTIESDDATSSFDLRRRRLHAGLAAEKREPRGTNLADRNLDLFVAQIAHDDCALSAVVSSLDSNPSLGLVELD